MRGWHVALAVRDSLLSLTSVVERVLILLVVLVAGVFVIVFEFRKARELYGSRESPPPEELTNCPSCGARIAVEAGECEYCGDPLASE